MKAWVQASRPIHQMSLALPVIFGQCLAFLRAQEFSLGTFFLVQAFVIFDTWFICFANDVADVEADALNTEAQGFSGGSRVIQEGKLTRQQVARGAWLSLAAMGVVAAALFARGFAAAPWYFLVAALLMHAYSYWPLKASYNGFGDIVHGIGIGLVLPLLGFHAQAGSLERMPWPVLLPSFFFSVASSWLLALPDAEADARAGKVTHAVRVGPTRAREHASWLMLLGIALVPLTSPSTFGVALAQALPPLLFWLLSRRVPNGAAKRFIIATAGAKNAAYCFGSLAFSLQAVWS